MDNKKKALLIQAIILATSFMITFLLYEYFRTIGFVKLSHFSSFLLLMPLGIYIIFGKHVYILGRFLTFVPRILFGLFLIFIIPALFLFYGYFSIP